jgi:hypothetical protein
MTPPELGRRLAAVWRSYAAQTTPPADVRDTDGWRAGVATRARRDPDLRAAATDLALEHPDAPAELIATALTDPDPRTALARAQAAADAAAAARRLERDGAAHLAAILAEPARWEDGLAGLADARRALDAVPRPHPGDRFLCIDRDGHLWAELGDASTAGSTDRAVALCDRCGLAVEYPRRPLEATP